MDNLPSQSNPDDPNKSTNAEQSNLFPPASSKFNGEPHSYRRAGLGGWITGLVLVVVGLIFLLQNFSVFRLDNWWALFLLIPTIASFASAYENYRGQKRFTAAGRGSLIGGFILLFLTVVFLFGLDLGTLWPIFLVIGGLSLLLGSLLRN